MSIAAFLTSEKDRRLWMPSVKYKEFLGAIFWHSLLTVIVT